MDVGREWERFVVRDTLEVFVDDGIAVEPLDAVHGSWLRHIVNLDYARKLDTSVSGRSGGVRLRARKHASS